MQDTVNQSIDATYHTRSHETPFQKPIMDEKERVIMDFDGSIGAPPAQKMIVWAGSREYGAQNLFTPPSPPPSCFGFLRHQLA